MGHLPYQRAITSRPSTIASPAALARSEPLWPSATSFLVIIYHLLRDNQDYHDLGPHFFETLDTTRQRDTAVRRLQALGYKVTLEERLEVSA